MTNPFLNTDWRKQAEIALSKQAAMTATNDLDIEKAFSDQASGFVENCVGDLMKDQYRIGFEIVKKNSDNTRMVGIFAFKVDKDLLFAPVFFLNGDIKGPLIYRCTTKTFVPATKEWAAYLIEAIETQEGMGRDRARRTDSAPLVQMQRIMFRPPGMNKMASTSVDVGVKVQGKDTKSPTPDIDAARAAHALQEKTPVLPKLSNGDSVLKMAALVDDGTIELSFNGQTRPMYIAEADAILKAASTLQSVALDFGDTTLTLNAPNVVRVKQAFFNNVPDLTAGWEAAMMAYAEKVASSEGLIREFLEEPTFGKEAADLLVKAASSNDGYDFANMLASIYKDPADLFPESYTVIEKKAAAPLGLTIQYSPDVMEKSAAVSKEYFQDGFYIQDTRPEETMSVVWETAPSKLEAINNAGVYSLLKDDGSFEDDVFVAQLNTQTALGEFSDESNREWLSNDDMAGYGDYNRDKPNYIAIKNGKVYRAANMVGTQTKLAKDSSELKDTVQEGKTYLILADGSDTVIGPVAIKSVKTADGVKYCAYENSSLGCGNSCYGNGKEHSMTINPDLDHSDVGKAVFGSDTKFIEIATKKKEGCSCCCELEPLEHIGSTNSIDNWVYSTWHAPKVTVLHTAGVSKVASYTFSDGVKKSAPMNKCCAMVKLARDMGISARQSYEILDAAKETGSCSFYLNATEKVASRLQVIDRPNFDDEFDSEFGIPLRPVKEYALRVQGDQMFEPPSAIGDAMNPTSATGLPNLTVATTAPEDLRALADTYHLPHVFEHGVVGTLADTFDSMALMDKYLPKIEDGVDALGRIKFLMHWCPGDFEKAYGNDDMVNLEAEIDASFISQGSLLLKLLKKADKRRKNMDSKEGDDKKYL